MKRRGGWDNWDLDFVTADFLNKELSEVIYNRKKLGTKYLDKLAKIYIRGTDKFILIHMEFESYAKPEFAPRTGHYRLFINARYPGVPIYSFAFVHNAYKGYKPRVLFNTENNGVEVMFEGVVIKEMKESDIALDDNPLNLVLKMIWLFEHKTEFGMEQKKQIMTSVLLRAFQFRFEDEQRKGLMIFLLRYVRLQFSNRKSFITFMKAVNELEKQFIPMSELEQFLSGIEAKGRAIGEKKADAALAEKDAMALRYARFMQASGKDLPTIAKETGLDIEWLQQNL